VQITRAAAPGANGELPRQMRLRARRERRDFLVPNMHPLDLALPAKRVGQPVQTVADNPVDPLDASSRERIRELISNGFCHLSPPAGAAPETLPCSMVQAPLICLRAELKSTTSRTS